MKKIGFPSDAALVQQYLPYFYADEAEPFPIVAVGWSVLHSSGHSPSFDREVHLPPGAVLAIEYAIYFDYDIQHLYDLEHVWIFVGEDGSVAGAQGSAHGGYFDCLRLAKKAQEETHLSLYLQPGKHAIFPDGHLFQLYPNYLTVCNEDAGKDGVLVPDMLAGRICKSPQLDTLVHQHIWKEYRFVPTLRFQPAGWENREIVPIEQLLQWIPERVNGVLEKLGLQ